MTARHETALLTPKLTAKQQLVGLDKQPSSANRRHAHAAHAAGVSASAPSASALLTADMSVASAPLAAVKEHVDLGGPRAWMAQLPPPVPSALTPANRNPCTISSAFNGEDERATRKAQRKLRDPNRTLAFRSGRAAILKAQAAQQPQPSTAGSATAAARRRACPCLRAAAWPLAR